ncbi:ddb1- and cul4-associated factor 4 [Phtheirospermum japonicum]|uniref:Ddb1-and cul4-associated factor 4 n=1 Tax=Phtheirospermum japonicum TaxID=374723 RepID=A0A830D0Q8_9LAMI|nr:ddb1- and cul4-associated factor 4 [Phtheirospermum japonicum]
MLDIETKERSWVLRCKSDALSVQFDQSGKSILCGLRNGSISTVDTRQKQIRGAHNYSTISMPSSVCCLVSLEHWDQYFLASSMDGSIRLYDHRLTHRGPVQSYEGNVNSHTRIDLGVDPSEKVVMSGGEDCYLRLWNIKSGEMLFKERFMDTVPSAVCWPKSGGDACYWQDHCSGAWLGSYEGIFYMDWL